MAAEAQARDETTATTSDATSTAAQSDAQNVALSTTADALDRLRDIRARVLPIFEAIRTEYTARTRLGYPQIVDSVETGGVVGLNFDPGFGVYFMTDGTDVWAELHTVSLRTDALSAANTEKFAGRPKQERREIGPDWTGLHARNFVSELLSAWNYQQLMIYRVDS